MGSWIDLYSTRDAAAGCCIGFWIAQDMSCVFCDRGVFIGV